MIRRPPRSTLDRSSAASDVYKRQVLDGLDGPLARRINCREVLPEMDGYVLDLVVDFVTCVVLPAMFVLQFLSLIHISEPTRPY